MNPRDIFALIVRVVGLGLVVLGSFSILHLGLLGLGVPFPPGYTLSYAGVTAFEYNLLGYGLLFGARPITRTVYGQGP